jgi:ferredoxin-NADP reductase
MAMLRHRVAVHSSVPARLLYSSRSYEQIIYREELERLGASGDGLQVIHTLTRSAPPDWAGYRQRIDRALLAAVTPSPAEHPQIFVCGPTALVEAVATGLVELGHDPFAHLHHAYARRLLAGFARVADSEDRAGKLGEFFTAADRH